MGTYPTFTLTTGDRFIDVYRDGVELRFLGTADFDQKTFVLELGGFEVYTTAEEFIVAYYSGYVREVPGAGNIREVV